MGEGSPPLTAEYKHDARLCVEFLWPDGNSDVICTKCNKSEAISRAAKRAIHLYERYIDGWFLFGDKLGCDELQKPVATLSVRSVEEQRGFYTLFEPAYCVRVELGPLAILPGPPEDGPKTLPKPYPLPPSRTPYAMR